MVKAIGDTDVIVPEKHGLSGSELERYSRHIKLEQFGLKAQLELKKARVLIVGAGGLGNPIGLYLAGAGVGTIGVADFDTIAISNLHRQIAFETSDVGQSKVDSLIQSLRSINPEVSYVAHSLQIEAANVSELIAQYDLIIDGSDNFSTRFLLGDACRIQGNALLHGAVHQFQAQIALFDKDTSCFRCLYREPPGQDSLPACNEAGILNVVTGTVGLIMATEAVKYLSGLPTPSRGSVLLYDSLNQLLHSVTLPKDLDCPLCGSSPTITKVENTVAACSSEIGEITVAEAKRLIAAGALLLDVRDSEEFASGHLENAMSVPLNNLLLGEVYLPKDQAIVTYCKTGQRSARAVSHLNTLGFNNAFSIAGGITSWNLQNG